MGLSQESFGLWAGTAINDTSSVVAAATVYGATAGVAPSRHLTDHEPQDDGDHRPAEHRHQVLDPVRHRCDQRWADDAGE